MQTPGMIGSIPHLISGTRLAFMTTSAASRKVATTKQVRVQARRLMLHKSVSNLASLVIKDLSQLQSRNEDANAGTYRAAKHHADSNRATPSNVSPNRQLQGHQFEQNQHQGAHIGDVPQPANIVEKRYLPPLTRSKAAHLKQKPRHPCTETSCMKDFARTADVRRHVSDVHQHSDRHYECDRDLCPRKTRRLDKMREHCRKVHKQERGEESFSVHYHDSAGKRSNG